MKIKWTRQTIPVRSFLSPELLRTKLKESGFTQMKKSWIILYLGPPIQHFTFMKWFLLILVSTLGFLNSSNAFAKESGNPTDNVLQEQPKKNHQKGQVFKGLKKGNRKGKPHFGVMISPAFFLIHPLFTYFDPLPSDTLGADSLETLHKNSIKPGHGRMIHSWNAGQSFAAGIE